MGPLSWVIIGALIGGSIAFVIIKIKAWAQSLAILKGRGVYVKLKRVYGKLKTILRYSDDRIAGEETIREVSDDELYQLYLDGEITYSQYLDLKNDKETQIDVKWP